MTSDVNESLQADATKHDQADTNQTAENGASPQANQAADAPGMTQDESAAQPTESEAEKQASQQQAEPPAKTGAESSPGREPESFSGGSPAPTRAETSPSQPADQSGDQQEEPSAAASSSAAAAAASPDSTVSPDSAGQTDTPAAAATAGSEPQQSEERQQRKGLSGLRVKIGSLADPDIAKEAKPRPGGIEEIQKTETKTETSKRDEPQQAQAHQQADKQTKTPSEEKPAPAQAGPSGAPSPAPPRTQSREERSEPQDVPPPRPKISRQISPDLEQEIEAALGGDSIDDMLGGAGSAAGTSELEAESKVTGKVLSVHEERQNIFVDLPGAYQGVLSLKQFEDTEPPQPGDTLELIVRRFNQDEGLYELSLPNAAVEVGDWSQVEEGMVVQATVTGHNKGGLECEVSNIRAFMPASQIALHRVENFDELVGESFPVIVTEAKEDRRNLVVSRRAVLEREKKEAREKLLEELAVGQTREGVVRSLQKFGAFVDLGGADGLIHVSELSWDRVNHPGDVLQIGQSVRVKVVKYDRDKQKIGLSYRDLGENPWDRVEQNYPVGSQKSGTVSKIMDFGAFVRLEAGVEGLIHISELAHQRVHRVSDVLSEGQEVDVQVVSVDPDSQRIGLSLKAMVAKPTPVDKAKQEEERLLDELEAQSDKQSAKKRKGPLKGGRDIKSGGEQFGLKW